VNPLHRIRTLGRHRGKTPAQLRTELDQSTCHLIGLATEIDGLRGIWAALAEELDAKAIDLETAHQAIRQLEGVVRLRDQQIDQLKRKVDIGVKAEHIIAKTQALDTGVIRSHCAKPIPLHQSPLAATDDTQPLPKAIPAA
jgi:chromosome segregation ATPase